MDDTGVLYEALKRVKTVDGLALLNCRESDLVIATMRKTREKGSGNLLDYNNHFPHVAESAGGAKRILLAHNVGVRAHFREVSTAETVEMLRHLKPYRGDMSAEVRPDHLVLNHENTSDLGPYAQQWTPIRTRQNQEALWGAINDGTVNIIASDHATHTVEEKKRGWENIWESPPGLPAIESMLPILLTAVSEGKTSLERVISATTANPARRLGLYPRKGCIAVGSDADLVVIDIKKERKITADEMYTKSKWTPYEGWTTRGAIETTILRGVPVYRQGKIVSEALGRFIFG
jgi:dihydroorotase